MIDEPATQLLHGRNGQRLGELVLHQLKERLLDGQYRPGTRISIEEVRAELGVSKQPVMDAMRRLQAAGLVEIVPQSGCRVATYPLEEIRDFFAFFARSEGEIAAAAAARRTPEQLVELDGLWSRLQELEGDQVLGDRLHGYRLRNREFHLAIHRMAHSGILGDLSARMWDLSDFFVSTLGGVGPLSAALPHRNHDHAVIRDAIRTRNVEVARVAMQSLVLGTVRLLDGEPTPI